MSRPVWTPDSCVLRADRFEVHAVDLDRRSGGTHRREVVATRDAVVVLPLLDDQTLVLIHNHRHAVGEPLWELPAGTIEPGEDPDPAAARELEEEAGYRAASIRRLLAFYPSPGLATEHMTAYLATGLTHVGQSLDETERITVKAVGWSESMQMVRDGRVRDGKTIALLLYYDRFERREA